MPKNLEVKLIKESKFNPYSPSTSQSLDVSETTNFESNQCLLDTVTMTTNTPITDTGLKILLDGLPIFDDQSNLSKFLKAVDSLVALLSGRLNADQEHMLYSNVLQKIRGEPSNYINNTNATNWTTIRTELLNRYGDLRDESVLENALESCFQINRESYLDLYSKIVQCLNDLCQYVNLNVADSSEGVAYKKMYERKAVKQFILGLQDPYRSYLRLFEIKNLQEAIAKCQKLENENLSFQCVDTMRKLQSTPKVFTQNKPTFAQPKLPFNNLNIPTFRNNFVQASTSRNVQTQSIPRQYNFQNHLPFQYNADKSNLSKPIPATKPLFGTQLKQQSVQKQFTPTPMSISTKQTSFRPTNYFASRPGQVRNFISEELHSHENKNFQAEQKFSENPQQISDFEYYNTEEQYYPQQSSVQIDEEGFDDPNIEQNFSVMEQNFQFATQADYPT